MKLPGCTRGTEIVVSSFKTQGYLRKTLQNGFLLFHLLYVSERGLNCLSVLQGLTHNASIALGKSSRQSQSPFLSFVALIDPCYN